MNCKHIVNLNSMKISNSEAEEKSSDRESFETGKRLEEATTAWEDSGIIHAAKISKLKSSMTLPVLSVP